MPRLVRVPRPATCAVVLPLVVLILGAACAPPPPVPLFDLTHAGPHLVGVKTVSYVDSSRGRTLVTEIWYPASGGGTADFEYGLPANTWRDADAVDGVFPLALFSHSWEGFRLQTYFLCARLASEGFVVVAPDHPGSTQDDYDPANMIPALTLNPEDLAFLLDVLPADPFVAPHADFSRVAAIGHSLGAYSVLALGAGHEKNGVPKDPRVDAVVALNAPDFVQSLAALPPVLMLSGTMDTVTPPPNQAANYASAALPKMHLTVTGGSHLAPASNWCSINDTPECNPPYMTDLAQYEALDEFTVEFLRFALDGDVAAHASLDAGPGTFASFLAIEKQGL